MMQQKIKKAALLLKSLNEDDRQWFLTKLEHDESISHERLFDELKQLEGIVLKDKMRSLLPRMDQDDDFDTSLKVLLAVDAADISGIKAVFDKEPKWVRHVILDFYDWSWKDDYLKTMAIRHRSAFINEFKDSVSGMSYKVKQALVEGLYEQLQERG